MSAHCEVQGALVRRPVRNTLMGLLLVVFFPVALAAAAVYLVGLSARLAWHRPPRELPPPPPRPPTPVNSTPCGPLCAHALCRDDVWTCNATMDSYCRHARPEFCTQDDPNNCTMFKLREDQRTTASFTVPPSSMVQHILLGMRQSALAQKVNHDI